MHKEQLLYASGKLLLTGEYLVMHGATALAAPLKFGQSMAIDTSDDNTLTWTAKDTSGVWFQGTFRVEDFTVFNSTDNTVANKLATLFQKAVYLNPSHFIVSGIKIETTLNFNRFLGFGSSSTLVALVAELFGVDKFLLHKSVSSGSGYDIACSNASSPLLYTRTSEGAITKQVNFKPTFADSLMFIYLGNKQDTSIEVAKFLTENNTRYTNEISQITEITKEILTAGDIETFINLVDKHEEIMERVLDRESIRKSRFNNFQGAIKSLGAWGGDFIMAASKNGQQYMKDYFTQNNVNIMYPFEDIVLNDLVKSENEIIIRF
jgi:mevalonate kinase